MIFEEPNNVNSVLFCQYINTFFNTEFDLYFKIQILCVLFFSFCKQTMRQRHGKRKTCRKQRLLRNWLSEEYNNQ